MLKDIITEVKAVYRMGKISNEDLLSRIYKEILEMIYKWPKTAWKIWIVSLVLGEREIKTNSISHPLGWL